MIVKAQRPLFGGEEVLVYDRRREVQTFLPMTPEFRALFGDRYKIYVEARLIDTILHLGKIVPDCAW